MCLRRHIEALRLLVAVAPLALAGCATSDAVSSAPSAPATEVAGAVDVPAKAQTLYERAVAAMAAGNITEAEFRFEAFALEYPEFPATFVNLAIIYAENGDLTAADDALVEVLKRYPDYAPALNQMGILLRRNGKFLEAEAAYLKAVTASPEYALAHYNLGILNELYLQRLDVALQHFEAYQALVEGDRQVEKWIADLRRRVAANQRTANVAE